MECYKNVAGRKPIHNDIHTLNINGKIIINNQCLTILMNIFLTVADNITNKIEYQVSTQIV
jgi:hypothetical protein